VAEREPEDDPLAPRRGRRRVWPTLGLAFGALLLLYLGGWLISGARFSSAVDRLRAQGEPVRPSDMLPKLKPGERNAADVYERALSVQPKAALQQFRNLAGTLSASQQLSLAQSIVGGNPQYYDLVEQASRLDTCAFPGGWDDALTGGPIMVLRDMRLAATALDAKAKVQACRGDLDGALGSCAASLRVARHVEQAPSYASALFGSLIQSRTLGEVGFVLSQGDPSPGACRSLATTLASRDHHALLARSLRGQRAFGLQSLRWMETGGWLMEERPRSARGLVRETYPVVAKPPWNADKEQYLDLMAAYIEAAQRPWPDAGREVIRLDKQVPRLFGGPSMRIANMMPTQAGEFTTLGQDAALSGAWQIALALKAYHHDHHTYPASLAELEKATWKLPRDPFTQQPYHYRRKGAGFAVWSVGFDGKDDGGRQFTGSPEEALQPGTDFVLDLPQ
jgi:hypothetical protein